MVLRIKPECRNRYLAARQVGFGYWTLSLSKEVGDASTENAAFPGTGKAVQFPLATTNMAAFNEIPHRWR